MNRNNRTQPFIGIFLNPVYVQVEGLNAVFDRLQSAGATAITTCPYVAEFVEDGIPGDRFPDLHVDGYRRVLSRPIHGKREIRIRKHSTIRGTEELFAGQPYRPPNSTAGDLDPELPEKIIVEAQRRGMEAHLQLAPFLVPGLRDEDLPRYPDGSLPRGERVSPAGCPNSEAVREYGLTLIEAAVRQYASIDGLFVDWTEYGAYALEDNFMSFSLHSKSQAERWGYDWEAIRRDVGNAWGHLHALDHSALAKLDGLARSPSALLGALARKPGWAAFLDFKAHSIRSYYGEVRDRLNSLRPEHPIQLSARGWPPPWNVSSGMDYRRLSEVCDNLTPKLFSFDYCAMPAWYADTLLKWNPGLDESRVLDSLIEWMQLPDDRVARRRSDYYIPAPEEEHPAHLASYQQRIVELAAQTTGNARLRPFAHAYMPDAQWQAMVEMLRDSEAEGIWVQMYGYLSDEKLGILKTCLET